MDVCRYNSVEPFRIRARDFNTGIFDCLQPDGRVMRRNIYALCCTPVLFGVDASATGFMDFWLALVLTSIFIPIIWVFGFIGRLHMRKRFNMQSHPLRDLCSWFWCCNCSMVQESKFMEEVFQNMKRGRHDVEVEPKVPAAKVVEPAPADTSHGTAVSSPSPEAG